jgi:hypothetical protein
VCGGDRRYFELDRSLRQCRCGLRVTCRS